MVGWKGVSGDMERPSGVRESKTVVCVVAEGLTENNYLDNINKNNYFDNSVLELRIADKTLLYRNVSDRMNLIDFVKDWSVFISSGLCPLKMYVSIALDYCFSDYKDDADFVNELKMFRDELCNDYRINCSKYVNEGRVPEESTLYEEIFKLCNKRYPEDDWYLELNEKPVSLIPKRSKNKQFYVMFDRDYDEDFDRGKDDYIKVLDEIERCHYHALVTTPQFELWLLMHFNEASFDGIEFDSSSGSVERRLKRFDPFESDETIKKVISEERFDGYYRDSVMTAITTSLNSEMFTTDPRDLENKIGTNLGIFLRDVLGIKSF